MVHRKVCVCVCMRVCVCVCVCVHVCVCALAVPTHWYTVFSLTHEQRATGSCQDTIDTSNVVQNLVKNKNVQFAVFTT